MVAGGGHHEVLRLLPIRLLRLLLVSVIIVDVGVVLTAVAQLRRHQHHDLAGVLGLPVLLRLLDLERAAAV